MAVPRYVPLWQCYNILRFIEHAQLAKRRTNLLDQVTLIVIEMIIQPWMGLDNDSLNYFEKKKILKNVYLLLKIVQYVAIWL